MGLSLDDAERLGPHVAARHPDRAGNVHALVIPDWRPTPLNMLLGNHFRAGRMKKSDAHMVRVYAGIHGTPPAACKRRVDLHVVPVKGQRRADPDAFWKSALDALKQAKLLVDDSARWCEPGAVTQGPRATDGPPRTVITLTDLEGGG